MIVQVKRNGRDSFKTKDDPPKDRQHPETQEPNISVTEEPKRIRPGCPLTFDKELRMKETVTKLEIERAMEILTELFTSEDKRVSTIVDAETHRRSQLNSTTDQTISTDCPICLEPVAYSANARFPCCGARLCMPCEVEWAARQRAHTTVLQCRQESMERRRNAWTSLKSLKQCPCCRMPMPGMEKKKALLDKHMKANKGWAYTTVGLYMREGAHGYPKNKRKAFQYLLKGAELGDSYAQVVMSAYYDHGEGCTPDFQKAYYFIDKCCDKGMAAGQLLMGHFYENGKVVKLDIDEAIRWYTLSSAQGSLGGVKAMLPLISRNVDDKDKYNLAIYWSLKLAEHKSHVGYAMLAHLLHDIYLYYHFLTDTHDKFGCGVSPYPLAKRLVQRAKKLEVDKRINRRDEFADNPIDFYVDEVMKPINAFKLKCAGDCGKGIEETGTPLRACSRW